MSKERQQRCPNCRATLTISPGQESVTCGSCGSTFRLKRARFRGVPDPPPEPPPIVAPAPVAPTATAVTPPPVLSPNFVPMQDPPQEPLRRFPPLTPPTGPVPPSQHPITVTIHEPVVTGIWLGIGILLAPVIVAAGLFAIWLMLLMFFAVVS